MRLEGPWTYPRATANRRALAGRESTTPSSAPSPSPPPCTPSPGDIPRQRLQPKQDPSQSVPPPSARGSGSAAPGETEPRPPPPSTAEARDFIVSRATLPRARRGRRAGGLRESSVRAMGRGLRGKYLKLLCPDPEAAGGGRKVGVGKARP